MNVPYESRDVDLGSLFEKFGELEVCRVVMDRDTEHFRGKWQLSSHIVTEMVKPCISNFGEMTFFSYFVASESDLVLTKFTCRFAKMFH